MYIVYHIRNRIANTTSYSRRDTEKSVLQGKNWRVGKILTMLCKWKKAKIVEVEVCPAHVHMLVKISPKVSVSQLHGVSKR